MPISTLEAPTSSRALRTADATTSGPGCKRKQRGLDLLNCKRRECTHQTHVHRYGLACLSDALRGAHVSVLPDSRIVAGTRSYATHRFPIHPYAQVNCNIATSEVLLTERLRSVKRSASLVPLNVPLQLSQTPTDRIPGRWSVCRNDRIRVRRKSNLP